MRKWRADNPGKNWARYLATWGITPERYTAMLEAQDGRCAICGVEECETGARFSVDHDHACCPGQKSCGECVRGLLCRACNHGLGSFRDSVASLRAAVAYLGGTW